MKAKIHCVQNTLVVMNVNKVIVDQNTVKLTKYTEKKIMLYIHIKMKCDIFPARPTEGMLNGIKSVPALCL